MKFKKISPSQHFESDWACTNITEESCKKGSLITENYLITSGREKIPINLENLGQRGLILNREVSSNHAWPLESVKSFLEDESVANLDELYKAIRHKMQSLIIFEDERLFDLITCWIIGTYFHRLMPAFPYLHFQGNAGCGKTKVLSIIAQLAFRAEHCINSSAAATTRLIHKNHSTCCIDEVEHLKRGEDNQTLVSMFNSGYKYGAVIKKCETINKSIQIVEFDAYSPKVFGGIGAIHSVLTTRCIPIIMPPIKVIERSILHTEVDFNDKSWDEIRGHLYHLMLLNFKEVRQTYKELDLPIDNLNPRDWELWRPIFTIAKSLRGSVVEENLIALMQDIKQLKDSNNDDKEFQVALLECLLELIEKYPEDKGIFPVQVIENYLCSQSGREEFRFMQDRKSNRWIGFNLKRLGVITQNAQPIRIMGETKRCFTLNRDLIDKRLDALAPKTEESVTKDDLVF